jgi:hypothetical protein
LGKVRVLQIAVVLVCVAITGALIVGCLADRAKGSPIVYDVRPTFYNLPVIIFSNSSYTEEIREHISYSTFNYDLTSNVSHIANASNGLPIIIDGYSVNPANNQALVNACSEALLNGSVIITIWQNAGEFMQKVYQKSYARDPGNFNEGGDGTIAVGFWNGTNGVQPSQAVFGGTIGSYGPSMTTLTQSYEWSIRIVYDQPYHPTLYP